MTLESAATFELPGEPADPASLFASDETCPICETHFELMKVRKSAIQPASRGSDFHMVYRTVDPSRYIVTVCPECSYASLGDDWEDVSLRETAALRAARGERQADGAPYLCGDRSDDDSARAIDLALSCYADRPIGVRRRAGLLHRRAWVERARGDHDAEMRWLVKACEAYRDTYENSDCSDEEAFRFSYLVGDLYCRIGEEDEASRWLTAAVGWLEDLEGRPGVEVPAALARMARERLGDARNEVRHSA